jgi:hypothetical protein
MAQHPYMIMTVVVDYAMTVVVLRLVYNIDDTAE